MEIATASPHPCRAREVLLLCMASAHISGLRGIPVSPSEMTTSFFIVNQKSKSELIQLAEEVCAYETLCSPR